MIRRPRQCAPWFVAVLALVPMLAVSACSSATTSGTASSTASSNASATASGTVAGTEAVGTASDASAGTSTGGLTGSPGDPLASGTASQPTVDESGALSPGQEPIGTDQAEDPSIEAWSYDVRVVFPLSSSLGTAEEFDRITRLEEVIINAAEATGDVFDGNDLGQGTQTDYVFTNQPDPLVAELTTRLRAANPPKGTRIEVHEYLKDPVLRSVTL